MFLSFEPGKMSPKEMQLVSPPTASAKAANRANAPIWRLALSFVDAAGILFSPAVRPTFVPRHAATLNPSLNVIHVFAMLDPISSFEISPAAVAFSLCDGKTDSASLQQAP
jgi:hypothetical protein